eukprot:TRINITY_DN13898_c0_g1_i1.p1 TRINITY_DN13898_c0_g1~~TRINITY_DN13898_c0_g1_i1.p1  ORF type:complete len:84 (-),score=18.36 TRINITY_DN13898_c0_g1_i1:164-415(-)
MSTESHDEFDSFIFFFSGHGYNNKICGHDVDLLETAKIGVGVLISDITEHFQSSKCLSLSGKPKIFCGTAAVVGTLTSQNLHF